MDQLLVCGILIAPAEVFPDRSGEEDILLENDSHSVTKRLKIVLPHIASADLHSALRHIVKTRNQLDQCCLCGAGTADDADGGAGRNLEINVSQGKFFVLSGIAEGDLIELDAAVLYVRCSVFRGASNALMIQDFGDTVAGFLGHAAHNEYHGQHHHGSEDLDAVADQGRKFTGGKLAASGADDELRTEKDRKSVV